MRATRGLTGPLPMRILATMAAMGLYGNRKAMDVEWTQYLKYRAALRAFDLDSIERIVKSARERYMDTATNRRVAVGRCGKTLVLIPYELREDTLIPITIHATSRRQIEFRLKTGRFVHE
jgi:hypothetical protein